MEFLEKLVLSYTSKIDDKILSEKKRLYGPSHVAMAVCKRISHNNQYLDKLSELLYIMGRYPEQH
jgi:cob(I)alamin adenosyltransferase